MRSERTSGGWVSCLAAAVVAAALACLHLHYPLNEDQALFLYAARELNAGARLYGEFWDMKQPGIYWWYQATGAVFGFDAMGVRLADLVWSVAVAVIIWATVRSRGALAAFLAPVLSLGSFYAIASHWHLSQVELIVAGPMTLLLWCLSGGEPHSRLEPVLRFGFAGAVTAVVGLFKLVLLVVPAAMFAAAFAPPAWRTPQSWRLVVKSRAIPVLAGATVVLAPVALWMAHDRVLANALWVALRYPPLALQEYQRHAFHQLFDSMIWFARGVWALLPWALYAAYRALRYRLRLELLCLLWIGSAMFAIASQFLSFWEYHFDLLFIPVATLAALGFAAAVEQASGTVLAPKKLAFATLFTAGIVVSLGTPLQRKLSAVTTFMPFTPQRAVLFDASIDGRFPLLSASAAAVRPFAKPGEPVIVWGDPRLYFLTGFRPVLEVNGATVYLSSQLQQVAATIRRHPPALFYLSKVRDALTYHADGIVPRTVFELYEAVYEDDNGIWYRLRR